MLGNLVMWNDLAAWTHNFTWYLIFSVLILFLDTFYSLWTVIYVWTIYKYHRGLFWVWSAASPGLTDPEPWTLSVQTELASHRFLSLHFVPFKVSKQRPLHQCFRRALEDGSDRGTTFRIWWVWCSWVNPTYSALRFINQSINQSNAVFFTWCADSKASNHVLQTSVG